MMQSNDHRASYTGAKPVREGSGLRGWIEDSVSKLSGSNTMTSLFDNTVFSGSKYDNSESEDRPQYKSKPKKMKVLTKGSINIQGERPREYYCQNDTGNRLSRQEANNIELLSRDSDATSSMYSLNPSLISIKSDNAQDAQAAYAAKNEEFLDKYQTAKDKQKKYKKEIKVLKMEKKQLLIKNRELTVDREVSIYSQLNLSKI